MNTEFTPFSEKTPFLCCRIGNKMLVKIRNPTTENIDPKALSLSSYLKFRADRQGIIDLRIVGKCLAKFNRRQSPDLILEEVLKTYEISAELYKEKKMTLKEKKESIIILKFQEARKLLKEGYTSKAVAGALSLTLNDITLIRRKMKKKKIVKKLKKGRPLKLTRAHISYFYDLFRVPSTCFLTIPELRLKFLKRFGLDSKFITNSGLRKTLKKRIKLRWKKISFYKKKQIENKSLVDRNRFIIEILPYIQQNYRLVFLDECSFNLQMMKNKGWGFSNQRIYRPKTEKSCNYSLLAAISKNTILAYNLSEGSTLTETYSIFIEDLLKRFHREGNLEKTVFISDNAKIHKSQFFTEFFSDRINLINCAIYSPELNPIELLWSQLKAILKKSLPLSDRDDLSFKINQAFKIIQDGNILNYFKHTLKFYKNSLFKLPLYES